MGPFIVGAIVRSLRSFELAAVAVGAFLLASGVIVAGVFVWECRCLAVAAGGRSNGGQTGAEEGGMVPVMGGTLSMAAAAAAAAPVRAAVRVQGREEGDEEQQLKEH